MSTAAKPIGKQGYGFRLSTAVSSNQPERVPIGAAAASPTYEIIRSRAELELLRPQWEQLFADNRDHRLCFQSFSWISAWLDARQMSGGAAPDELFILAVHDDGKLRALCPFVLQNKRGLNHLILAGAPVSQYSDIITDGQLSPTQLIAALEHACDQLRPDIVHLRKVRTDAAIQVWLKARVACSAIADEAPYLDLSQATSFDDYCARYTAKARKNRRRLRRRLSELGCVRTHIIPPGNDAAKAIGEALAFKRQWLIDRGHVSSALRDPAAAATLQNFATRHAPEIAPFVSVMTCNETTLSVQFGIVSNHRLALHLIAYNPETEKSGAGVLHIEDTIQYCFEAGLTELDLLAPNAPYKQAWADGAVGVADYFVPRTVKGGLYAQGYLRSTRGLLKTGIAALPLNIRRKIAELW